LITLYLQVYPELVEEFRSAFCSKFNFRQSWMVNCQ